MGKKHLLLFDIDGTLTEARKTIQPSMIEVLKKAREVFDLAVVGGSDRPKQLEQLQDSIPLFDRAFSENGTFTFDCENNIVHMNSISKFLGEDKFQKLVNFVLSELAQIELPFKRGNFIEYRKGMINVAPAGRSCTFEERTAFVAYNQEHNVLNTLANKIEDKFGEEGIKASVGGQISMDVFPVGWDKTYCLQFITDKYEDIHFFGDKYYKGGNDFEIYEHERTIGHKIENGPKETEEKVLELVKKYSMQFKQFQKYIC